MREIVIELRGIARRQVVDYFLKQGAEKIDGRFVHPDFTGEILSERCAPLGSFSITELRISLKAKDPLIETLAENFRQCFLRMGG